MASREDKDKPSSPEEDEQVEEETPKVKKDNAADKGVPTIKSPSECKHEEIGESKGIKVCLKCSRIMRSLEGDENDASDAQSLFESSKKKKEPKSIKKDLDKYDFPSEIKDKANE